MSLSNRAGENTRDLEQEIWGRLLKLELNPWTVGGPAEWEKE